MAQSGNDGIGALSGGWGALTGGWAVTEIAYAELPPDAEVTMFFADGNLSGRAACNYYEAEITVEGDKLGLAPMQQGHQECGDELMQAEVNFLRVLEPSNRFEIAPDGTLTLFAQDFMMLKARRLEK